MRRFHGIGVVTTVAAAMLAASAAMAAETGAGAVPDPNLTGVAPSVGPTAAITPGQLAPEPISEPALQPGNFGETIVPEGMLQPRGWQPKSGIGLSISAGGGAADFSATNVRENTGFGGYWEVRGVAGTRNWWAIEGEYNGSAQSISGLGTVSGGTLVRNGLETTGRLNLPLYAKSTLLEPYAFGGVGWNIYNTTGVTNAPLSDLGTSADNVFTLPFGLGFAAAYHGLIADARFTYRPTFGASIIETPNVSNDLSNWNLGAELGYEF